MLKRFVLGLVIFLLTSSFAVMIGPACGDTVTGNIWITKAQMPTARGGLGVVAVGGTVYAIGGSTSEYPSSTGSGGFLGTNEEYNITTGVWTYKAPMPVARSYFAIAAYQGKIYCIGGQTGWEQEPAADYLWGPATSSINEVYDIATNSWQTLAPMPIGEMYFGAEAVDGLVLVRGIGFGWVYNVTADSWSNTTALPFYSWYQNGNPTTFLQINVNDKTLKTDVQDGAAAETSGINAPISAYVIGSRVNEVYNPSNDNWTRGAVMLTPRNDFGLAVSNDLLYAIGGFSQTNGNVAPSAANEQYIPFGYGTQASSVSPMATSGTTTAPNVPEFPTLIILALFAVAILLSVVFFRKIPKKISFSFTYILHKFHLMKVLSLLSVV